MSTPLSKSDADALFAEFLDHPKLVWGANNTGCEARADLMAEIAHAKGYGVSKIWIRPQSASDSFLVYLNDAGTETMAWNYHVAILVKMETGTVIEPMVIDPSLFDGPVTIYAWKKRLARLSDQYDVGLEIVESRREAFFGPEDMANSSNRQNALTKREEILANSSNLADPVVLDGFMIKLRGEFVDRLMETDPERFEKLKVMLRDGEFSKWFKKPLAANRLKAQLENDTFFGIECGRIKALVDVSAPTASVQLKEHFWEPIGRAFQRLTDKSEKIQNGGFNTETMTFKIEWEDDFFRHSWYSPDSNELWKKYGLSANELQD